MAQVVPTLEGPASSTRVTAAADTEPLSFEVGRSPNRHITFGGGSGQHLCLGAHLAKVEVQVRVAPA